MTTYEIVISSTCRNNPSIGHGPTSTNFTHIFSPPLTGIRKLVAKSIAVPFTYYGVNSSNNALRFEEPIGGAATATIPPGNYSATSIASELATQLNATSPVGNTYNVTYSATTGRLTINNTTGTFRILSTSTTAQNILGLASSQFDGAFVASIEGSYVISITGPTRIYITCTKVNDTIQNGRSSSVLVPLIVDVNWGEVIVNTSDLGFSHNIELSTLSSLTFGIQYEDGSYVDLNNQDWSMVLELST